VAKVMNFKSIDRKMLAEVFGTSPRSGNIDHTRNLLKRPLENETQCIIGLAQVCRLNSSTYEFSNIK